MKMISTYLTDTHKVFKIFGIKIKKRLKKTLPKTKQLSEPEQLFEKYKDKQRFEETTISFMDHDLIVPDAPSFAYQVQEIFTNECYKFASSHQTPLIYDCGANIGISILYFKTLFPNAIIKAFEADEKICTILEHNVQHLENVEVFQKAVWINNETISFNSEGADAGSLVNESETK